MFDRHQSGNYRDDRSVVIRELWQLACMYHALGNYEKSEEILRAVQDIEERQRKRERARQKFSRRDEAA